MGRAEQNRHARRNGARWTAEEDQAVLAATSDMRAVAARLGRSTKAVQARRTLLRRRHPDGIRRTGHA